MTGFSFKALGSFYIKSPKCLHLALSDFDETCSLGSHSTNSQILGQSNARSRNYYSTSNFCLKRGMAT